MMMDQEEHLIEKDQPKCFTRSAARHLRRKRLHDARKAEKQKENLVKDIVAVSNREFATAKSTDQPELITKSKARRLRKKNKAKQLQNCCSYCESYCEDSALVIEPINNQEVVNDNDTKDIKTLTKSKAQQIRKDNKTGWMQCSCYFCCDTYISIIDPILAKYSKPEENDLSRLTELVTEFSIVDVEAEMNRVAADGISRNSTHKNLEHNSPMITSSEMTDNKVNVSEKSREEIKAEREAKKAAKALAKAKAKSTKIESKDIKPGKVESEDTKSDKVENKDTSDNKSVPLDSKRNKQNSEIPEDQASNKAFIVNKTVNACIKNAPAEGRIEGKSKAELRAERRAKQEAQRAAKQQHLEGKSKVKTKEEYNNKSVKQITGETEVKKKIVTPKKIVQKDNSHEINLFKHLYHEREQAIVDVHFVNSSIHPAIVRLGTQYENKVIVGSNARCVALLATVKQLIQDFERPSQADFIRGLEATLQESIAYLHHCRPLAVSMQNALRHLKWQMTQLSAALSDIDAKNKLINAIDTYILEQIQLADKAISITIQTKISNGDVILTYGYSSLIHKILLDAHTAGKQFRVIVVDGRPWLEGKEQLRRLAKSGIECSYILINALSYVMPEVSKVFLGAHAILANGAVMSRVGTAQVALMARAFNIPVLVACETHKSCERVQTDSIVYNELGNADELAQVYGSGTKKSLLANWKTRKSLNLLNITYDVTPADLVTAVVTELAILPCTSVPVILRIKPSEI
nr:translation initiation factor eIF-2B subunit delta isoform X1 [Osmia lignaria]XP_034193989.1 translation initiation factor eIF-2B subunit delta isoform X1 [Osmia lignaria]XP_034193990.1 translation initiation factor eIF-2B subunit delta isoform X1 [Osmia lignaria]XP_034193991.1 translation initiation factor eIF-2B subunit delta isoform X1 [Osmia lignaria]